MQAQGARQPRPPSKHFYSLLVDLAQYQPAAVAAQSAVLCGRMFAPAVPLHGEGPESSSGSRPADDGRTPDALLPFSEDKGLVQKTILISAPPRRPCNSHINHNSARRISTPFFCFFQNIPECGNVTALKQQIRGAKFTTHHPSRRGDRHDSWRFAWARPSRLRGNRDT